MLLLQDGWLTRKGFLARWRHLVARDTPAALAGLLYLGYKPEGELGVLFSVSKPRRAERKDGALSRSFVQVQLCCMAQCWSGGCLWPPELWLDRCAGGDDRLSMVLCPGAALPCHPPPHHTGKPTLRCREGGWVLKVQVAPGQLARLVVKLPSLTRSRAKAEDPYMMLDLKPLRIHQRQLAGAEHQGGWLWPRSCGWTAVLEELTGCDGSALVK